MTNFKIENIIENHYNELLGYIKEISPETHAEIMTGTVADQEQKIIDFCETFTTEVINKFAKEEDGDEHLKELN